MSLTLFARDFCYWSEIVEGELERLKLAFMRIPVGHVSHGREEIERLTGQPLVPVLMDDEEVYLGLCPDRPAPATTVL